VATEDKVNASKKCANDALFAEAVRTAAILPMNAGASLGTPTESKTVLDLWGVPVRRRGRQSEYRNGKSTPPQPGDEAVGEWPHERLVAMDERFCERMKRTIAAGEDSRNAATATHKPDYKCHMLAFDDAALARVMIAASAVPPAER
jgi:hypothetical protein